MGKFSHCDDPKNGNSRFWCKFENNCTKMKKISKILKPQHAQKTHKSFHVIIQFHRFMIIYLKH
jgi:hypothetical protein